MDVFPINFRTLFYFGVWSEENESCSFLKLIYRVSVFILIFYFTATSVIELMNPSDVNDLSECGFLTLSFVNLSLKWINLLFRKKVLLNVLNKFRSTKCQPQSAIEVEILEKYSRSAKNIHIFFVTLTVSSGVILVLRPLANFESGQIELPFKTYHPYDVSKKLYFLIAYAIHGLSEVYGAGINSSFDAMCYGLMIMVSGQYELCCHRLTTSINNRETIKSKKEWIAHHILMCDLVREIESFFIGAVAVFFFCTLITVCTTIFKVSQTTFGGIEFFTLLGYIAVLFFESFLYCYNGNNLEIKSQDINDAVYNSDWTILMPKERRNLLLIMLIGQKGTYISYRGQCTLTLSTFMWEKSTVWLYQPTEWLCELYSMVVPTILCFPRRQTLLFYFVNMAKTSYGAFNLLQRAVNEFS